MGSLRYPAMIWFRPSGRMRRLEGGRFWLLMMLVLLLACGSLIGVLVVPRAISAWTHRDQYRSLIAQRELLGRRLNLQVEELDELQPRIAQGLEAVTRLRQAVGLDAVGVSGSEQDVATSIARSSIYFDLASARLQIERTARLSLNQWGAELQALEDSLVRDQDEIGLAPTILPLVGEQLAVSADFGRRQDPMTGTSEFHAGLMIAAPVGTRLVAPAAGRVAFTGVYRSARASWQRFGRMVVLRHGERYISIVGHCGRIRVSRGEQVERGQWIADSGDSGLPPHPGVYYEVRRRDMGLPANEGWIPLDPKFFVLNYRWPGGGSWRSGAPQAAVEHDRLPYAMRK